MTDKTCTAPHDLFAAVAAHLRGDVTGVLVVLDHVGAAHGPEAFPFAAVMSCGEYLRDAAHDRAMEPARMLALLRAAHSDMVSGRTQDCEGILLSAVSAYVCGSSPWWTPAQHAALTRDPQRCLWACVRVAAASLTWAARDRNLSPQSLAADTCLAIAARACEASA